MAEKEIYSLNMKIVQEEVGFDGFYSVRTNFEDKATEIATINHRRWKIEENFRIMKSKFKARPAYLQRDDRIEAHFTTCFIVLVSYRLLKKTLEEKDTYYEIISTLRNMDFLESHGNGDIPAYTRTNLTDFLHATFGFHVL